MARYLAGHREPREVVNIDYADVLRQAVANERANVLREVRKAVEAVEVRQPSSRNRWDTDPRDGAAVKGDVLAALNRIEDGAS